MYEELRDQGFELIAVAEDTAGEAAAGRFYDAAEATFTTLIDVRHTLPALFSMVNVPTAVLIDEEGQVVRHDEDAYSQEYRTGSMVFGNDRYVEVVRDWVANGPDSIYAQSGSEATAPLREISDEEESADAYFRMAVHFFLSGDEERAGRYWDRAQELNPDSWNYHRQDWSFLEASETGRNWIQKFRALGDKPYYRPLDLPESP